MGVIQGLDTMLLEILRELVTGETHRPVLSPLLLSL
ncbi:hypothetical protein FHS92_002188 [Sphingobium subterraneum]|uniref:Uncharacterized protein n=1 Tax=Sphingobium subterraneum TaxID=627688 RepID=A0A841J0J6_9SPHN|nr:hypothetical protein [Sphingobium subterraneum]